VIAGPEAENKRQSGYAWLLLTLITLALFATAYVMRDMYEHPTRPSDCNAIVDYAATCVRATTPTPTPGPGPISLYLGTLGAAILAVLLVRVSWDASVTKQANLVTAFSGTAPVQASTQAKPGAPAANATLPPLGPHVVEAVDTAALNKPAPITIRNNTITNDMIAPPKAEPKKGVDATMVKQNG
jgi:hypothetical protein